MSNDLIYLDYAGAGQFDHDQLYSIFQELKGLTAYGNPHSCSAGGRQMASLIDDLRRRLLNFFNTTEDEYCVIFTANCTTAAKLLVECFSFKDDSGMKPKCDLNPPRDNVPYSVALQPNDIIKSPAFIYLNDNHTSILGMREIAMDRNANVFSITERELERRLANDTRKCEPSKSVSLFVFPGESNFNGRKYPLRWIDDVKKGKLASGIWCTLLDATSLVPMSPLNLSDVKPDFVTMSFYKMFGYPTGLGALLVRNATGKLLMKTNFFGGGTATHAMPGVHYHEPSNIFCEQFEFGTTSYLDIISLKHGLDAIKKYGGMDRLSQHVAGLATYLAAKLEALKHESAGKAVAEIYSATGFNTSGKLHGGKVTFNLMTAEGQYIPKDDIKAMANKHGLQIGVGYFCNMGALQHHLDISDEVALAMLTSPEKHINIEKPLSAIRVSFGKESTESHVDKLLEAIRMEFMAAKQ